jgi:hypothetical protein
MSMTHDELIEFLREGLGICGCSNDDQAVGFVFDLLEAGEMRDAGLNDEANETLADMIPEGDCLERNLPIYWITAAGLTEHGFSLETYGLSELGDVVLEALRTHGTGEELWENAAPDLRDRTLN